MYYEIYIDRLVLINFVMNWYSLELTNILLGDVTSRGRLAAGALLGAVLYILPVLTGAAIWIIPVGCVITAVSMIFAVFPVGNLMGVLRALGIMTGVSLGLGGGLLLLEGMLPVQSISTLGSLGIMGLGGLVFLAGRHMLSRSRVTDGCLVELVCEREEGEGNERCVICVKALVDTGNSLVEPISGRPVCILEQCIFEKLADSAKQVLMSGRKVPFCSMGQEDGSMWAYLIPEIHIYRGGMMYLRREIYVGVYPGRMSGEGEYSMILQPSLLEGQKGGRRYI